MRCFQAGAGLILLACLFLGAARPAAAAETTPPAVLRVRGLGWWQDRAMRTDLTLLLRDQQGVTYDTNAIEDGAMLILAQLTEEGHLHPRLTITATPPDQPPVVWAYEVESSPSLPRPFAARTVEYQVQPGPRYRVARVEFTGLQAIPERQGLAYFQDNSAFAGNPWQRAYSPAALRRMQNQLATALRNLGHAEARVETTDLQADDQTGKVVIKMSVTEGPRWQVASVSVEDEGHALVADPLIQSYVGRPWSELLDHDLTNDVRNACYQQGYPDVTVRTTHESGSAAGGIQPVVIKILVQPGSQIRLGAVHFEGVKQTRLSMLEARVGLRPGALLDPTVLEETRLDLARLGSFQSVDLSYQPGADGVREPVFTVRESQPWETSLLFGYGSFEQLRGGLEIRHFNFLGEAGAGELKLVQSTKSTRGDLGYTFPQLFGRRIESSVKGYALRRDELQLERRERGLRLAFSRPLKFLDAVATVGYSYQQLQYQQTAAVLSTEPASGDTSAASLEFNLSADRRDNLLRPRQGYHWFLQSEFASPSLGGNSEYQRAEFGGAYHVALAQGCWLHVGLTHGVVATWGGRAGDLPVNKLFFPGGDNSIRGFTQGEAAPRNADGTYSGARSYAVLNLETEFALAKDWSLVLFSDSLGEAVNLAQYPFDTYLFSVGAGLRYQSIIGPVRVEYGYNLNPRPQDPSGTLLFSLGFPF